MDPYLQQLFSRPDDFRLCDKIFVRISQKCDSSDEECLSKLSPGQRVVLDVWGSFGLIGNGGLSYLLSSDIVDIAGIGKSYDLIDVPRASNAFRAALALFPNSSPPKDNEERVEYLASLGKVAEERLEELSKEMWACDRQIKRNLAAFSRSHAADFAGLPPSPWEDLNEFKVLDLPPPPTDANEARAVEWLESIGAVVQRWDDAWADVRATSPAPRGNPIVSIRISEHRNSTNQELRHASTLMVLCKVRAIDLEATSVSSAGLNCLSQFPELRRLSLADTEVGDQDLVRLHHLKALSALRLNQTAITNRGIDAITGVPSLEQLELEKTLIDDEGLAGLASLPKLKSLSLRWTPIKGAGLSALAALPLENLELKEAKVDDEGLSSLRKLPHLKSVELCDTAAGDATLGHLAHATSLDSLDLSSTRITDEGLIHLRDLRELQYLSLSVTSVRGIGFKHFSDLTKLKYLHLFRTPCDDAAVEHLSRLQSLESLWMSETLVTDECCEAMSKLRNLAKLSLDDTQIEGGPKIRQLETLTKLEWISLPNRLSQNPNVRYLQQKLKNTEFSF